MWKYLLVTALTFYLLVPGVLVTLPPGGSRQTVLVVHAAAFAVVHMLTHKYVMPMLRR